VRAAIVARELGVPAIVGVKDATRRIRDGERIHVDPRSGRVVVVDAQLAPKSVTP
jgi:pyruvate,water dikinase